MGTQHLLYIMIYNLHTCLPELERFLLIRHWLPL